MRKIWCIATIALAALTGCEIICNNQPELCAPLPQEDVEEPSPPPAEPQPEPGDEYHCSVQEVEVDGRCVSDADGDGVRQTDDNWNPIDNCPELANHDQLDRDHDGIGDACEPVAVFTWHREDALLPEITSLLSLEALCVDEANGFVFVAESGNIEGYDAVNAVESIDLLIPYGEYDTTTRCYVLLRQNEQETPDHEAPSPGRGTYVLGGVEEIAPVIAAGPFAGYWEVTLRPAPAVD